MIFSKQIFIAVGRAKRVKSKITETALLIDTFLVLLEMDLKL